MIKLEGFEEVFSDMAEQAKPRTHSQLEANALRKAMADGNYTPEAVNEINAAATARDQIKGAL